MLKIGEFSKLGKITVKALHYYDEVGILKPDFIHPENGYRFYSHQQLREVSRIQELKEMGLSIDEIIRIFREDMSRTELYQMFKGICSRQKQLIQSEENKLQKIQTYLNEFEKEKLMEEVNLKKIPAVTAASMRKVVGNYDELNDLAPEMGKLMKKHGAVCASPAYCFNIYYDDEYKETDIDLEICEAVTEKLPDQDGVIYREVSGIDKAACLYHKGAYHTLAESYAQLFDWIEANGYEAVDHGRESYIDGCWNMDKTEDWLTEIQMPVRVKS